MKVRLVFSWILSYFVIFSFVFSASAQTVDDPYYEELWHLGKIEAPLVWEETTGDSRVIVAVIDTGVDVDHEDLNGNIFVNFGEVSGDGIDNDGNGFIDDVSGWDFYNDDNDASPENIGGGAGVHHGTVVSGLIGAVGMNGIGVVGVNWDVSILPLRVLASDGQGRMDDIVKAIRYAVDMDADVINMSFVGEFSSVGLEDALQYAYDNGTVVVAALGNDFNGGRDVDEEPIYPVCSHGHKGDKLVVGVTATNEDDERAYYSNYGADCADIAAPGSSIFTTEAYGVDGGYGGGWTGTSLSAPLVVGGAALIRSVYPFSTVDEVRISLQLGADPVVGGAPSCVVWAMGTGRLNLVGALDAASVIVEDRRGFDEDEVLRVEVVDGDDVSDDGGLVDSEAIGGGEFAPLVVGAVASQYPEVVVVSGVGDFSWMAYDSRFRGGISVDSGQLDHDSGYEVVTGALAGGGPHVRVFDVDGVLESQFFAFEKDYYGGIDVSVIDVDGDGIFEILVGENNGDRVRVFSKFGELLYEIEVGHVGELSALDLDGDLRDEILFVDHDGIVKVVSVEGSSMFEFVPFPGVSGERVGVGAIGGDDGDMIAVVLRDDYNSEVRVFDDIGALRSVFGVYSNSAVDSLSIVSRGHFADDLFMVLSDLGGVYDLRVYGDDGEIQRSSVSFFK